MDLGNYLDRRYNPTKEKASFFKRVDSLIPKRPTERVPEVRGVETTVYDEDKKKSFWSFIFSWGSSSKTVEDLEDLPQEELEEVHHIEEEVEEIDHEVEALEEKRDGLFARLFSILFGRRQEEDIDSQELPAESVELDENELLKKETRATLKIIHKWISRLPPEQIDAFKRSPDFARYKELLDKYNLIR